MSDDGSSSRRSITYARTGVVIATTGLAVGGGLVLYALAPTGGRGSWLGLAVGVIAVCLVVPFTVSQARSIKRSDRPIMEAGVTIVLLLTLLVLGFAATFEVVSNHAGQLVGVHTKIDALYFTMSTLSTVGYGDAHASGQAARLIVTVQMVFDLVFIATSVRLLVSVAQRRAAEQRAAG